MIDLLRLQVGSGRAGVGGAAMAARRLLAALCLLLTPGSLLAWSDHATLLWPVLDAMPDLHRPTLVAEPLEDFVAADPAGLQALLQDHERTARERWENYAPRPEALAFDPASRDLRSSFLRAIRVNPTLSYRLYRQCMPGEAELPAGQTLTFAQLSFLGSDDAHVDARYLLLRAGEAVSPAQVVAAASDEPDFGMDVGLFADNGTPFGADYGFGAQPFGNPNLEYSSQAPFHMGFYHVGWFLRTLQPSTLQTYPAWRVSLYQRLAQHAFASGHHYWGWRFTGWALHYIGDLTQPYHAEPLPGLSWVDVLWTLARGKTGDAIQLLSNRHGVLESYQYQRLRQALAAGDGRSSLLRALSPEGPPVSFDAGTVEGELTASSVAAADALDAVLAEQVPAHLVKDPTFEWAGSGEEPAVVETIREGGGNAAISILDAALAEQLERFARYAAAWVEQARQAP